MTSPFRISAGAEMLWQDKPMAWRIQKPNLSLEIAPQSP